MAGTFVRAIIDQNRLLRRDRRAAKKLFLNGDSNRRDREIAGENFARSEDNLLNSAVAIKFGRPVVAMDGDAFGFKITGDKSPRGFPRIAAQRVFSRERKIDAKPGLRK